MKNEKKSFDKLLKEMGELKEDQLGKLKGGIVVITLSTVNCPQENTGVCHNYGDCSKELNSGLCFNNKSGACTPPPKPVPTPQ